MGALEDALKGFTPVFGNQDHIRLMKLIKEYRKMQNFPTKAKSTLDKIRRLEESIIHQLNQSKSV